MFFPEDLYIARIKTSENVDFHSLKQDRLKTYLDLLQHSHLKLQELLFELQEMPGIILWLPHPSFPMTIRDILWDVGIFLQKATIISLQQKKWKEPKKHRFMTFNSLLEHVRKNYMSFLGQLMVLDDKMLEDEVIFPDESRGKLAELLIQVIDFESKSRGQIELILEYHRSLEDQESSVCNS